MSRWQTRHPDEGELLRYADGELPARRAKQVRLHLELCWECRTEFREIQDTVGECVHYRKHVMKPYMPPPEPWPDIYRGFADIDATPGLSSPRDILAGLLQFPVHHARKWIPAAVAVALAVGLYYQFRNTPAVQAAELLRKAVAAADTKPRPVRRIQIRTSSRKLTRVVPALRKAAVEPKDELQPLFEAAHFDWEDPLSARSFQAWHDGLPEKKDNIEALPDGFRLRTAAPSGEIVMATLKLTAGDLRPVEERLEFRNREWVEISELPLETAPEPAPLVARSAGPVAASPARIHIPEAPVVPAPVGIGDELRVMVALHGVGADLGDPVQVSRDGSRILVTGVGITPNRQRQIHASLAQVPNVEVRFSNPETPSGPAPASPPESSAAGLSSSLPAQLEKLAGGKAQFERLSAQLLDGNEAMMARAYALHHLAGRFPAAVEAELDLAGKRQLRQMVQDHAAMFVKEAAAMDRVLSPWLAGIAANAPPASQTTTAWQVLADELFQKARRTDRLLAVALGGANAESPTGDTPAQLLGALAQARAAAARLEEAGR